MSRWTTVSFPLPIANDCKRFATVSSAAKIDALLRKWLAKLPHPFTAADGKAGYRYDVSILQAEFSLTQVLDRPQTGRIFFEEVIRENLDIGRPDQVQLIFERRVRRHTPGRFRTRVLTDGVIPSLHVDYKRSRIKQYHKEGRAPAHRDDDQHTLDFKINKGLNNLPALRRSAFTPTDVSCTSNESATIAGLAKTPSVRSTTRWKSTVNGRVRCVTPMWRAGAVQRAVGVPSAATGFFQPRVARPLGFPPGESPSP